MGEEEYAEVEVEGQTYMIAHEGQFTGDKSREDIRVLEPSEVSDFEIGEVQAGSRVGVDPSDYDSIDQMYRDAVQRAQDIDSSLFEDEFFDDKPEEDLLEEENDEQDEDPIGALDQYAGDGL